ncbi:substrate-binding periplasmic protein [Pseudodesulfovibrio sediminis]|uniref:Solute-binding protein family 3/N-terminal domain-containing protein n=1 Tax=Pseudodesulfovibrio sediminis TaxID=2810563 RepID=A0ABM7P7H4_9BACT|nr:transporter substrate-binding domain-containing protein [Pseudodesulfovibrio sediminis]BCS88942.1 hypothetical protein PSDVSF_21840 [Pseudodesulfovibrio sediminis]
MKTTIAAALFILILLTSQAQAQEPLVFAADRDYAPYSMIIDGRQAGIDMEVLMEAAHRAQLQIKFQFTSWEELLDMVKEGEIDGAVSLFASTEREKTAIYMDAIPLHYSSYALFTKVGQTFTFKTYSDLKGKIIGKVAGIDLGDEFSAARTAGTMDVKEYPDIASVIEGVLSGELDAFAGNLDVTFWRLKEMGMTSSIVSLPKQILSDKPAYAVLSRTGAVEDKSLVIQKLERAMQEMRRDGTYNKIARRYLFRF